MNLDVLGKHLVERSLMEAEPDAVRQVPSRLLADSQIAGDYATGDTVFTEHNEPHGSEPLV